MLPSRRPIVPQPSYISSNNNTPTTTTNTASPTPTTTNSTFNNSSSDYHQLSMQHFNKKEYQQALLNLHQLLLQTTNTTEIFKIKHNIAIVKYFQSVSAATGGGNENSSSSSEEEKLLLELEEIKQSTRKHSNHQFPILIYNQSVLYYKKERYSIVLELLEPLFESLTNNSNDQRFSIQLLKYDEFLVLKICFLLLTIFIDVMKSCQKSQNILKYIDKNFQSIIQSTIPSSLTPQLQQLNLTELSITESKFNILYYKAKLSILQKDEPSVVVDYIQLANQVIKNYCINNNLNNNLNNNSNNNNNSSNLNSIHSIMTSKIALLECYLKLNNFHNNTPSSTSTTSTTTSLIKECIQLLTIHKESLSPIVYFNNLGCIYMLQNHNPSETSSPPSSSPPLLSTMSQFFFSKASKSSNSFACYNLAYQSLLRESEKIQQVANCLSRNNPFLESYELFHRASLTMYDNPYLWIRMGECILCENHRLVKREIFEAFQQMSNNYCGNQTVQLPVLSSGCGMKKYSLQKDVLNVQEEALPNKYNIELLNDQFTKRNLEEMSLEMAEKCFHNSLTLLNQQILKHKNNLNSTTNSTTATSPPHSENIPNSTSSTVGGGTATNTAATFGGSGNEQCIARLQQAIINVTLKLAYVSLCLDNPLISLSHCKTILSLSIAYSNLNTCPVQVTMMALSYAFEALTMTDQSEKVFQIVTPQQLQILVSHHLNNNNNNTTTTTTFESIELYQQILLLNLSIVHLIQGNYEKSQQTLNHIISMMMTNNTNNQQQQNQPQQQLLPNQIKPYFYCVQLYLLMIEGKSQQALELISTIKIK